MIGGSVGGVNGPCSGFIISPIFYLLACHGTDSLMNEQEDRSTRPPIRLSVRANFQVVQKQVCSGSDIQNPLRAENGI